MHHTRWQLTKNLFQGGTPWQDCSEISEAVEDMVDDKMTGHTMIEVSLLVLVGILWLYCRELDKESKGWKSIVEEHCKR